MVRLRDPEAAVSTKKLRVVTLRIGAMLGAGAKLGASLFNVFAPACKMVRVPAISTKWHLTGRL